MAYLLRKELVNNHLKLTKWAVQSMVAGASVVRIGFVTRKNLKDPNNHVIVGFYDIKTEELMNLTNFNKNVA